MKPFDNKANADQILEDWDNICHDLAIKHFLIYGTCLGFYRDGGYIPLDSDIDVRVMCDKKQWKELIKKLAEVGIIQNDNPAGYAFYRDDILLCIERSEEVGTMIHDNGDEWPTLPLYHNLDEVTYKGRVYRTPSPVEEYSEGRYGPDWRTPNPDWNNKTSGGA